MKGLATSVICCAAAGAGMLAGVLTRPQAGAGTMPGPRVETGARVAVDRPPQIHRPGFRQEILRELAAGGPSPLRLQALFMQWFAEEPDLWSSFKALESEHPRAAETLTAAFFTAWASLDCDAPAKMLATSSLIARDAAVRAIWTAACAQGNGACILANIPGNNKDWSPLERLASRDPALVLTLTPRMDSQGGNNPALRAIARGWAASGDLAVLEWAAPIGGNVFREACVALIRQNPAALSGLSEELIERAGKDPVLACLLGQSQGSPAEAATWLDPFAGVEDVVSRMRQAEPGLSTDRPFRLSSEPEWFPADPQASLIALSGREGSPALDALRGHILAFWIQSEPEAAGAYAAAQGLDISPAGSRLAQAVERVRDLPFEEAVRLTLPDNGEADWNGLSAVVSRSVSSDPAAATAFLMEHLPEISSGEGSWRMVLGNTMRQWSEADVPAATAWAAGLPEGPVRDAAIGGVVQAVEGYDPAAAILWLATMEQPGGASTTLGQSARMLSQQMGPVGARRTMEQMDLPPAVRETVLNAIREP